MIIAAEHNGTHIDALCHQAESMRLYGGVEVTAAQAGRCHRLAQRNYRLQVSANN
ncbi:MAG TPA: hypothetical protein VIJ28_20730 [Chloroflexota bacterium]